MRIRLMSSISRWRRSCSSAVIPAVLPPACRRWQHNSSCCWSHHGLRLSAWGWTSRNVSTDSPSASASNESNTANGKTSHTAASAASSAPALVNTRSGKGMTAQEAPTTRVTRPDMHRATSSRSRAAAAASAASSAALGKSKHVPKMYDVLRTRREKAPWGVQQLRDSWSEDAMSKRDRDNMDERIHREYRYHPDEARRKYIRYTVIATTLSSITGMSLTYYYLTGRPVWEADPQHLLNLIRVLDTSPRSKLYLYRLEETHDLPEHVLAYRKQHEGERVYSERLFRLTHSAFQRPDEDTLRRLELEEELKRQAAAAAAAAAVMAEAQDEATDDE